ncbi:hypothetical protein L9F63_018669 [Diploptera punctata]|uniref:Coiled-coil domain-containing protein 51 n=1 Tax=Diploptera punctata TaxID=6984 RepID=A0AAD7ZY18_DIPPU|nr:hypothetical protein L9F63_018669 [Diploptera punctata]
MAVRMYKCATFLSPYSQSGRNLRLCSTAYVGQNTNNSEGLIKRKLTELLQWYEDVTGMHEVRIAQNRVLDAEQKFVTSQERRRESNKLVLDIQNKLKDLYAELDNTTRGEERYVQLITQEHKMLKEERKIVGEFQQYEREERDYFLVLSSAVKESHEKERAQAERTKYWSIIGSIIGTIIGILGSSINNELKMRELRRLVKYESNDISKQVPEALSKHEKELSNILNEMKNITSLPSDQFLGRLNELVHTLDNKMNTEKQSFTTFEIVQSLKELENYIERHFEELKSVMYKKVEIGDNELVVIPYDIENKLQLQQQKTQIVVTCCMLVSLTVPFLCKYFGVF